MLFRSGINLAGVKTLFELEERLGTRILERLYEEGQNDESAKRPTGRRVAEGARR